MRGGVAPWWGLRAAIDDAVPSTGTTRQRERRSDLTTSIVLVLCALLTRTDLKSLRVGHRGPRRGKHDFEGLSRFTIACWIGRSEETVSQVLTLLRRAGLVHGPGRDNVNVIPQPVDEKGWKPAIRRLDLKLFVGLGMGVELHKLREWKPPAADPERERLNAGREIRQSLDEVERLARLFPNGPPDD